MIAKGQTVRIKPQYQDKGDDAFTWVALTDVEKGRLDITPIDTGLPLPPVYTVTVDMLED